MYKLKIGVIFCSFFILSGCFSQKHKVTKLTAPDDLIIAMMQNDYLTDYDSIESIEINERIEIEEQMEIFIQHAYLIKGFEVEITEDENSKFEKQDQLLLLYAIHNPNKKTAISLEANLFTDFLIDLSSYNRYIDIDMCEIKPGLFCKFKQSPYTLWFAEIEVDQEFIDKLTLEKTDIGVDFRYVIGSGFADLFFKQSNGSGTTKKLRKTFSLDFNDVDYHSKSND